jgi:hypothetical protein
MSAKRVYYFCERVSKPRAWSSELVCYRMKENDPRIFQWTHGWQKKGNIYFLKEGLDKETEMAYLRTKVTYERVSKITVKDAAEGDVELK